MMAMPSNPLGAHQSGTKPAAAAFTTAFGHSLVVSTCNYPPILQKPCAHTQGRTKDGCPSEDELRKRAEGDLTVTARAPFPLGLPRSKPRSVPLPHPRRAKARRLRLATLPCRCAPAPSRAARGRAVQPSGFIRPHPRGRRPARCPAAISGINDEGMRSWACSSTASN
jgi:hypothetical protein